MGISSSAVVGETPPGWDSIVESYGGTVFHSSAWADYQRQVQGCDPVFVVTSNASGSLAGAALALFRRSRHPLLGRLLRSMELPAHPVATGSDPDGSRLVLGEVERVAREFGCARLSVGSNFSGDSRLDLTSLGYSTRDRLEFVVGLEGDTDSLWKAIKKDQRDRIRRLERDGVTYEHTSQLEAMKELSAVRQTALERRLEREQGFDLPSDPAYYERLHRALVGRGAARLLLARQGGAVIAAVLYATFARKACSIFSGSTEAGYRLSAQTGLFWYAVQTFKQEGFRVLNRGGVPAAAAEENHELHGIYRFKHRLGTTPVRCVSGEKVLSPLKDSIAKLRGLVRNPLA